MKLLKQNSTHKALLNNKNNTIDIYLKGIKLEDLNYEDEYLYSIPKQNQDDLFAIFEQLDENNRINLNEFLTEIN